MDNIRPAVNGILIFFAVQSAFKLFTGNQQSATQVDKATGAILSAPPAGSFENRYYQNDVQNYLYQPDKISPIWPEGTGMDMSIYVSESLILPPLSSPEMQEKKVFDEKNIKLGDWDEKRSVAVDYHFSESVQHNGSLFAHIFVAKHGAEMDPAAPGYDRSQSYIVTRLLTRYFPKKKVVKTKKLIGASDEEEEQQEEIPATTPDGKPIITSYWHSNLTLNIVDGGVMSWPTLPSPLKQYVTLERTGAREETGRNGWYYPIIFPNEFWLLRDHMVELNSTVKSLPLYIDVSPASWWKFQVIASMDFSFKQSTANPNTALGQTASTGAELEEFKRVLIETNIWLLGTTAVVSLLHTIFEMLAFKNDISHWRNKKDNVGVSVRTILANVFMQLIIFLYLLDNSDGTSWMILFGQGFGILLEAWKITRMVDVKVITTAPGSVFPYKIVFEDKHKLSQLEQETKEYDEEAFRYLYWVAIPLLVAYAIYSLLYDTHKSWYSFIITTLVGSVYAYGFLMMVPSLYINYKLKSVAHMPRKTMIYKLLNTFIDDLFAFTIKMPTLHRLATLRDDVIYFIALYQSWIYRVDHRRINEFGQGGEGVEEGEEKKEEAADEEPKPEPEVVEASGAEKKKKATKRR